MMQARPPTSATIQQILLSKQLALAVPKVAVLHILVPSRMFLLPVTMDLLEPSPYMVTLAIQLVMFTISSYTPSLT
jgi:hypothetical protein